MKNSDAVWLCLAHAKELPENYDFHRGGYTPHILGVGQFASLAEFARLTATEKPKAVVLVGTCGSLHSEDIMRIYQCQHYALPTIAGEDLPEFLPRTATTQAAQDWADIPRATVLQNHGISVDAEKFKLNCKAVPPDFPRPLLENMEATSLAMYCRQLGVAFTALVCVTNQIGPTGRAEWRRNFRMAGARLIEALRR